MSYLYKIFYQLLAFLCYIVSLFFIVLGFNDFFINGNEYIYVKEINIYEVNQKQFKRIDFLNTKNNNFKQTQAKKKQEIIDWLTKKYGGFFDKILLGQDIQNISQTLQVLTKIAKVKVIYERPDTLQIYIVYRKPIVSLNKKLAVDYEGVVLNNNISFYQKVPLLKGFSFLLNQGEEVHNDSLLKTLSLVKRMNQEKQIVKAIVIEKVSNIHVKVYLKESSVLKIKKGAFLKMSLNDIELSVKNSWIYLNACFVNQREIGSFNASIKRPHTILE